MLYPRIGNTNVFQIEKVFAEMGKAIIRDNKKDFSISFYFQKQINFSNSPWQNDIKG